MDPKRGIYGIPLGIALFVAAFRLIKIFHHDAPPPELQAAVAAEKAGDFAGAIKFDTQALNSSKITAAMSSAIRRQRGFVYLQNDEPRTAVRDFDDVLLADPHDTLARVGRALAFFKEKDFERALANFDQVVALRPPDKTVLNNIHEPKALAEFYLGRFEDAEKDFRAASNFQPTNTYHALWLDLAEAHQQKDGHAELRKRAAKLNLDMWPGPLVRLYLGEYASEKVMEATRAGDEKTQRDQLCEANFYLGESALLTGKTTEASQHFDQASATCDKNFNEFDGAQAESRRLKPR
jgi:lipoprotein NlpI